MTAMFNSPAEASDPEGLRHYFVQKIEELNLTVSEKQQNLRRLQVSLRFNDLFLVQLANRLGNENLPDAGGT
jgi:hypothetical protein